MNQVEALTGMEQMFGDVQEVKGQSERSYLWATALVEVWSRGMMLLMELLKKSKRKCLDAAHEKVLTSGRLICFVHFDSLELVAWQRWQRIGKVPTLLK